MSKPSRRENRQFRKAHPRGRSKARRAANAANPQYVSPFPTAAEREARRFAVRQEQAFQELVTLSEEMGLYDQPLLEVVPKQEARP